MPLKESNTFTNNALKREILDLNIKCCLHEKGCAWTGKLRDCEMHGHTENVSMDVACVNRCGQLAMRRNLDDHVTYRCTQRLISCEDCNFNMKQVELKDHYKDCGKYL